MCFSFVVFVFACLLDTKHQIKHHPLLLMIVIIYHQQLKRYFMLLPEGTGEACVEIMYAFDSSGETEENG